MERKKLIKKILKEHERPNYGSGDRARINWQQTIGGIDPAVDAGTPSDNPHPVQTYLRDQFKRKVYTIASGIQDYLKYAKLQCNDIHDEFCREQLGKLQRLLQRVRTLKPDISSETVKDLYYEYRASTYIDDFIDYALDYFSI